MPENIVYVLNLNSTMRKEPNSITGHLNTCKINAILDVLKLYICYSIRDPPRKKDEICFQIGGISRDSDDDATKALLSKTGLFHRPSKEVLQYIEDIQDYCTDTTKDAFTSNFELLQNCLTALEYLEARNKKQSLKKIVVITDGFGRDNDDSNEDGEVQDGENSIQSITQRMGELDNCEIEFYLIEPSGKLVKICSQNKEFVK